MAQNPTPSLLDAAQIIKRVFNGDEDRLRVDAEITATISGAQEVVVSAIDDSIKIGDPTNTNFIIPNTDGSVKSVQLFTLPFDSVTASYPTTTQEVYESRVGGISGTVQQTITINYTDTTKNFIQDIART